MEDNEFIKNLEVIQNGIYGKDVRQAIYDLFKYQDVLINNVVGGIITAVDPLEISPTDGTLYN